MPQRKTQEASITGIDEWYSAGDAAQVLSTNSGKAIEPDYLHKLGKLGKIRTKKLTARLTLYSKPDVDSYIVDARGVKAGQTKRAGKTGPTVRELRKAAKEQRETAF